MNRLMRLPPRAAARTAPGASRRAARAAARTRRSSARRWCRSRASRWACRAEIGDYTDFYIGIHHATAVGKLFRPDNPLLPNYKWVPIGYHGRASSIDQRPSGPLVPAAARARRRRRCRPAERSGRAGASTTSSSSASSSRRPNAIGEPIPMADAEEHVFGLALFNDWSARDIQAWEYQPLGPFLSKNFASTLSPWIVTLDALAPFRKPFARPDGDPEPLPYLDSPANRERGAHRHRARGLAADRRRCARPAMPATADRRSNFADAYWTVAQLVAHHTVNGCNLRNGDLFGSGTLSGPRRSRRGSLLELTQGGKQPIRLSNGETRTLPRRRRHRDPARLLPARRASAASASASAAAPSCLRAQCDQERSVVRTVTSRERSRATAHETVPHHRWRVAHAVHMPRVQTVQRREPRSTERDDTLASKELQERIEHRHRGRHLVGGRAFGCSAAGARGVRVPTGTQCHSTKPRSAALSSSFASNVVHTIVAVGSAKPRG